MKNYGAKVTNQRIIEKFFKTLSSQFDHIVMTIEESKNLSIMSVNELHNFFDVYE